ncbi:MAG: hypothetical protein U0572_01220 [Phycisphaerales bacterium]
MVASEGSVVCASLAAALSCSLALARPAAAGASTSGAAETSAAASAWPEAPLPAGVGGAAVVSYLVRLGLGPDAVAAAGLDPAGSAALVSAAAESLADGAASVAASDAAVGAARSAADALRARVVAGTATPQELASWPSARDAESAALASRETLLKGLFVAATAGLGDAERAAAAQVRASAATWADVPPAYRTVERAEAAMLALRDALAAERGALRRGEEVDAEVAALLAQVRAEPPVAAALAASQAYAAPIAAAWAAESATPPALPPSP